MIDHLSKRLEAEDLSRVEDTLEAMKRRIVEVAQPTIDDLWERRLITRHLRTRIQDLLTKPDIGNSDGWKKCLRSANFISLENFTRQIDGDMALIGQSGVKHHEYAIPQDGTERRTYMGLHRQPFDHQGLSVVVAYKPTLHEQPYHAHSRTDENSLAIHPTTGFALFDNGQPADIIKMKPGEMIKFRKGTPHTLKNPTNLLSADVSVKLPHALDDRTSLSHANIGDYISSNPHPNFRGRKVRPAIKDTAGANIHRRYQIEDLDQRYRVDYLEVGPGQSVEHFDIEGIRRNTYALMTIFAPQGSANAEIYVGGDFPTPQRVELGEWLAMSDKFQDGVSLSNRSDKPSIVYLAREIE